MTQAFFPPSHIRFLESISKQFTPIITLKMPTFTGEI